MKRVVKTQSITTNNYMETNNFHSWNHNFKTEKNNKPPPNVHVARTTPKSEKIQRREM